MLAEKVKRTILTSQENEITEYFIYKKLAEVIKDRHNKKILRRIANDELRHYKFWKKYSGREVEPNRFKIWKYFLIAKFFGLTFGVKLMEKGEESAQVIYGKIAKDIPEAKKIVKEEDVHENQLLDMIDEELLAYVGSIVLGLNDALVELTGALAGLTLALQNTKLIAMAGLITGIAASFSMAASEYLSIKTEEDGQNPLKASIYTGSAYVLTVLFLIFPYLIFKSFYLCLGIALFNAILVIFIFTFYISVAKDISFNKRFSEMATISLGVAGLTFGIGYFIRKFLKVEI